MITIVEKQRRVYLLVSVLVVLFLTGVFHTYAQTDPATDPMPSIDYGQTAKAIITRFDFNADGSVTPSSVQVVYGFPRLRQGGPPVLLVQLYNDNGELVEEYFDWDPRTLHHGDPVHRTEYVESQSGIFVSDFEPDLSSLEIRDAETGDLLAEADLVPGIQFFCQQNPNDPECMADVSVTKSDNPDPVGAGATLDYTITVANNSLNPAQKVQVVDTLPAGVTFVSATTSTGAVCNHAAGVVTCDLERVGAGDSVVIGITVLVAPDLVYNNGGPTTITNHVTATNLAGTDPTPANNSDAEDTEVIVIADVAIAGLEVLEPPFELIIDTPTNVTLRTTSTNYGPSAPVDANLTRSATASADASVNPALIGPDVLVALGLNELRVTEDVFTIECTAPGPKTFTFASDIALIPLTPGDFDPDLSNNHAEYVLTVECVIPVEIDIRPGNPNNPINLGSKGVIQVIIFTNPDYVQYLEATDIDPATIDLAGAGAQQLGNGNYWTQERDVDRDGYTDLIVHIETEQIVPEELVPPEDMIQIEGCTDMGAVLRGATFDDIHVRGEDCVRIVPPNS